MYAGQAPPADATRPLTRHCGVLPPDDGAAQGSPRCCRRHTQEHGDAAPKQTGKGTGDCHDARGPNGADTPNSYFHDGPLSGVRDGPYATRFPMERSKCAPPGCTGRTTSVGRATPSRPHAYAAHRGCSRVARRTRCDHAAVRTGRRGPRLAGHANLGMSRRFWHVTIGTLGFARHLDSGKAWLDSASGADCGRLNLTAGSSHIVPPNEIPLYKVRFRHFHDERAAAGLARRAGIPTVGPRSIGAG
jgi:hypothetical protein